MLSIGHIKTRNCLKTRTQSEVADALGCSQQIVSRIARGEFTPKSYALVDAFRAQLGVAPGDWSRAVKPAARRKSA